MKTMLLFPAVAILLSLNTVSANEGNSLEVSAALAMLDAKNVIEHHYQFCRDKAGDQGYRYDYVKYIWELKNQHYIRASEEVFKSLPISTSGDIKQRWKRNTAEFLSSRGSTNSSENGKYCSQYFSQLLNGAAHNMSAFRAPLVPKLATSEEVRILERNSDMEVGCVKTGYNRDIRQFESLRKACDCQTTLIVGRMSNREVDDYLALVAGGKAQDAVALLGKKIAISELQACYSQIRTQ